MSLPRALLHLEGAALFAASTWGYFALLEGGLLAYLALLLVPDVSMVGFVRGTRLGALTYNVVHNEALALALAVIGLLSDVPSALGGGLILAAHVGMDRALGYGLKYPSAFRDTHLQRL